MSGNRLRLGLVLALVLCGAALAQGSNPCSIGTSLSAILNEAGEDTLSGGCAESQTVLDLLPTGWGLDLHAPPLRLLSFSQPKVSDYMHAIGGNLLSYTPKRHGGFALLVNFPQASSYPPLFVRAMYIPDEGVWLVWIMAITRLQKQPSAPTPQAIPHSNNQERPLAVLLDNAKGYPQAGLKVASSIYEMPVEGGLTRLMAVYDHTTPARVGPIRGARPYFVDLVESMRGVLVHDGGSPAAMAQILRSYLPHFDVLHNEQLFVRDETRSAPYNLYAAGAALRKAVAAHGLERSTPVSGDIFRPASTAENTSSVTVDYSAVYKSGFAYLPKLSQYRWQRDGESAVDAASNAVLVDAVVVAHIEAQPLPNDPAGRLYIPIRGGKATLYIHGKQLPGSWSDQGGFSFSSGGKLIDLTPFKVWVLFAPQWANISQG